MSQRDLTAELRASRVAAPAAVREHVRLIAAAGTRPRRTFTWRRALLVALPVAAALAAVLVIAQPNRQRPTAVADHGAVTLRQAGKAALSSPAVPQASAGEAAGAAKLAPAPSGTRAQRYGAALALRLPTPERVSGALQQTLRITASLGGYPTSVHATSAKRSASADLVLKVPRAHVQQAITRLSALGTIASERVDVQDVQAGIDRTARTIDRLQRRLRELRAEPQTPAVQRRIAALTTQIEILQRARAEALRTARYATIALHLSTPAPKVAPAERGHGPLHGLGVAFHWIWIGAVYVLALGLPLLVLAALVWLVVRAVRRRREEALLSSP